MTWKVGSGSKIHNSGYEGLICSRDNLLENELRVQMVGQVVDGEVLPVQAHVREQVQLVPIGGTFIPPQP